MILDHFINIAEEITTITSFIPCNKINTTEQNLQRVDEIINELRSIDTTSLCAEMMDCKSKDDMRFKLSIIDKKIGDKKPFMILPDDWQDVLSNPFKADAMVQIKNIMGEQTTNYIIKWNRVFCLWGFISNKIINTIKQMQSLINDAEPQQCRTSKEQEPNETMEQWVQRKFDEVKENAINWHLIEKDSDGWKWKLNLSMYAYFWGSLLCGDYIKDCGDKGIHWVWDRKKPLTIYENIINSIIPFKSKSTLQELRTKGASEYERCVNYYLVDKVIKGGL